MFIPVTDHNPLKNIKRPYATWGLIAVNVGVFAWQLTLGERMEQVSAGGGLVPIVFFGGEGPEHLSGLPGLVTLITYQFLHLSLWHLVGNMVFLYIFGDNIEDATGHVRFVVFYLICGAAAGFVHAAAGFMSKAALLGASGATSGLVGAYLVLHPHVRFWVLAFGRLPLRLKAYWIIGAWVLWQIGSIAWGAWTGTAADVAWFAHLGGFFMGAVLIIVMRRRNVPLWDKNLHRPAQAAQGDGT